MIPQPVPVYTNDPQTDALARCSLARKWIIDERLAAGLMQMATEGQPVVLKIISGYRTPAQQDELRREGRPTAPNDKSTHLTCPATGADFSLSIEATDAVKAWWGGAARRAGLRWGGGSPVSSIGIPQDWNHVDLGPRSTA